MAEAVISALDITSEDLAAFHAAHFSSTSVVHFAEQFLGPVEEGAYAEETEDDGLGYYEDGVKRTLTDEQIAIFRHSEIQASLRERRHAAEAMEDEYTSPVIESAEPVVYVGLEGINRELIVGPVQPVVEEAEEGELEDGELGDDFSTSKASTPKQPRPQGNKKNKKNNKNAKKAQRPPQPRGFFRQNVKPDLRKRTWDVVDAGLGNLDYDEDSGTVSAPNHAAQRRRISYDD